MPLIRLDDPPADPAACTALVQRAFDALRRDGGGRVALAAGRRFVCGTVRLGPASELHLEPGSVLEASGERAHYQETSFGGEYGGSVGAFLLFAEDADGIAVTGTGTIDGQALRWMQGFRDADGRFIRDPQGWRPRGIGFYHCRGVRLESLTIRDLPQWTVHLTACRDVVCHGLSILNRLDVPNCDGIDPDRCQQVRISACHIEAGDDAIVLKNTREFAGRWADASECSDIAITGNTLVSTSAALKIGTESHGAFRRIVATGNVIRGSHRGIALQLRDSGTIEDVVIADSVVETRRFCPKWWGNGEAVAITCVPRSEGVRPGRIRRVRLANLLCRGENGIVLHGTAASPIEDLALSQVDVRIAACSRWPGGRLDLRPMQGGEHTGLSERPEAGLIARHIAGLQLDRVRIARADQQPWYGPLYDIAEVTELAQIG